MRNILIVIFVLITVGVARAQNTNIGILKRALTRIKSLKSVSYQQRYIYTNPLSQGDTSVGRKVVNAVLEPGGAMKSLNELTIPGKGINKYALIYRSDTLFTLDYADSIYSVDHPKKNEVVSDLSEVASLLKRDCNTGHRHPESGHDS